MRYKIEGTGPQIPNGTVLFTDTAKDAITKRQAMIGLCGKAGVVTVYDNGTRVDEATLHQLAEAGT
jgi:hypothetical protein